MGSATVVATLDGSAGSPGAPPVAPRPPAAPAPPPLPSPTPAPPPPRPRTPAANLGRCAGATPSALVPVGPERALRNVDPTCPTTSSLRFALSRRGADFEDHGEIALACAGW